MTEFQPTSSRLAQRPGEAGCGGATRTKRRLRSPRTFEPSSPCSTRATSTKRYALDLRLGSGERGARDDEDRPTRSGARTAGCGCAMPSGRFAAWGASILEVIEPAVKSIDRRPGRAASPRRLGREALRQAIRKFRAEASRGLPVRRELRRAGPALDPDLGDESQFMLALYDSPRRGQAVPGPLQRLQ